MTKDVLLVRAGQYHLAVLAAKLLEIVDLKMYRKQQEESIKCEANNTQKMKNTASHTNNTNSYTDRFRLWRHHVLPVIHLCHYLDNNTTISPCNFSLVYQINEQDILFLDVDHIFSIIHMDTSQMQSIVHPYKDLARISKNVCFVQQTNTLAFILEDELNLLADREKHHIQEQNKIKLNELKIINELKTANTEKNKIKKPIRKRKTENKQN